MAIQVLDLILTLCAFSYLMLPLIIYMDDRSLLYENALAFELSLFSLGGMMYLHWSLKRFLMPMSPTLRAEFKKHQETLQAECRGLRRFWNAEPGSLIWLAYLYPGMNAFVQSLNALTFSGNGELNRSLYENPMTMWFHTLFPPFYLLTGLMWQARQANRFMAEKLTPLR